MESPRIDSATPMMSPAVRVDAVTRTAGEFSLGPVSFDVPTGAVVGMVGPNGAGKTTTVRCLLGMTRHYSGNISVLGRAPGTSHDRVGVSLDDVALPNDFTALRASKILAKFYKRWNVKRFEELIGELDVPAKTRVKDLSRGERSKLSFSIALAHEPQLLILDEPTSGLDPVARTVLVDICRDFMVDESHSILFSTHITADLENFVDKLVVVNRGLIAADGSMDELMEQYAMVRAVENDLSIAARNSIVGAHCVHGRVEGLIRVEDTALFGPEVIIETPTIDELVVALCRPRTSNLVGVAAIAQSERN